MNILVENKRQELGALCKLHKVSALSLFGSVAQNSMNENSDVDFLVRFSDDIDVLEYSDNYFSLLHKLELLFKRHIDLVSEKSLKNAVLIAEIERTKILVYAA